MFGRYKMKRNKNRLKREKESFDQKQKDYEAGSPEREKKALEFQNEHVKNKTEQGKLDRQNSRKEGVEYGKEFLNTKVEGLDPKKRSALQYEANRNIDREAETANRKLLGDQSSRGIVGKGGVGYAQQRDLQRLAGDARAGVHRDLDKLNSDLEMKKLAALFNIGEGEAAQNQLDKQGAIDELQLVDERKRQRNVEDQLNRLFSRI